MVDETEVPDAVGGLFVRSLPARRRYGPRAAFQDMVDARKRIVDGSNHICCPAPTSGIHG